MNEPSFSSVVTWPRTQVPAIRGWFDTQLRETLFPMLAARYPEAIRSEAELRVMLRRASGVVIPRRASSSVVVSSAGVTSLAGSGRRPTGGR